MLKPQPRRRIKTMNKVKFLGSECDVVFGEYENGRTAIRLMKDGIPYAMATINDPDEWLEPNQVLIKNYSENEGMVDALVDAGIVERDEDLALPPFGASVWVCNLLVKP
jgi:hypothetical protein